MKIVAFLILTIALAAPAHSGPILGNDSEDFIENNEITSSNDSTQSEATYELHTDPEILAQLAEATRIASAAVEALAAEISATDILYDCTRNAGSEHCAAQEEQLPSSEIPPLENELALVSSDQIQLTFTLIDSSTSAQAPIARPAALQADEPSLVFLAFAILLLLAHKQYRS